MFDPREVLTIATLEQLRRSLVMAAPDGPATALTDRDAADLIARWQRSRTFGPASSTSSNPTHRSLCAMPSSSGSAPTSPGCWRTREPPV